ncbi:cobalamin biosynthesis protein [Rhodoferax aquaticus]|uniref:Cobalamin biosynthesis protein CbiB n=1 Tax=Rhodoferax aquaticus TaxID=2527691 RepID=A0A515ERS7_9BURK|nr:cobalamin biosynthesis protein [Rhodoferax aquaticus]QDL55371.1 cobalamin biosynthesis protein CbiB [Rhodoferax aquaticus]
MSFISILIALLLEQVRPLAQHNLVHTGVRHWVRWVLSNFDAGKNQHAWLAWTIAVLLPGFVALAVHWLLVISVGWAAAAVWSIAILYSTLGFRQFSHHFTKIRDALDSGDEENARRLLAQWMRIDATALPRTEIIRHVIEHSVLHAHRYVFGVLACYTLLAAVGFGPAGAVIYRIAEFVKSYANRPLGPSSQPVSPEMIANASLAWNAIDWLPARATALGFAFVGSFEEAVDGWRQHEQAYPGDNDGVILAATSGAVNVKLGPQERDGPANLAQGTHLRAVVGLVWRTVVMWMVFLILISLAKLLS